MKCKFACKTYVRKNTTEVNLYSFHSEISFVTQTFDEEPRDRHGKMRSFQRSALVG